MHELQASSRLAEPAKLVTGRFFGIAPLLVLHPAGAPTGYCCVRVDSTQPASLRRLRQPMQQLQLRRQPAPQTCVI